MVSSHKLLLGRTTCTACTTWGFTVKEYTEAPIMVSKVIRPYKNSGIQEAQDLVINHGLPGDLLEGGIPAADRSEVLGAGISWLSLAGVSGNFNNVRRPDSGSRPLVFPSGTWMACHFDDASSNLAGLRRIRQARTLLQPTLACRGSLVRSLVQVS